MREERQSIGRVIGRYVLGEPIASGGMATVHLARLTGPVGFSKPVAIKRLHPHYANNPEVVSQFLDEARLAARIRHPNVVSTLDVVVDEGEVFLVMDYVHGESLATLIRLSRDRCESVSPAVAATIFVGVLSGLHAAHEAFGENAAPLSIVHRDISPQNILIGADGIPRVVDFGIAKATGRIQTTTDGHVKGKTAYMAPEQIGGKGVDRRTDVYAASVVLWELLTGTRLFDGETPAEIMMRVLEEPVPAPSARGAKTDAELDTVVKCGLSRIQDRRFSTAREMAEALEKVVKLVTAAEVSAWVTSLSAESLALQKSRIANMDIVIDPRASIERLLAKGRHLGDPQPPDGNATLARRAPNEGLADSTIFDPNGTKVPPIDTRSSSTTRARLWIAAGLAVALLALLVLFARHQVATPDRVLTSASTAITPPTQRSIQGPPSATSSAPLSAPSLGSIRLAPSESPRPKSAQTPAPNRSAAPRDRNGCNPPYTIDSSGLHVPKLECLDR